MENIYFIGGSPCSGKSTVAEMIASKYNLHYFKVDDYLFDYIAKAKGKLFSTKASLMTVDETWLRNPTEQCEEEFAIYKEIFEFIVEDIGKIQTEGGIIAEGAAFLPELMKDIGIDEKHYICIVPTWEFQNFHYKKRPWVPHVLGGCSNKEVAFKNWMKRDALFAIKVKQDSEDLGYKALLTDGTSDIECTYNQVCKTFLFM